ncbi:unnamed protein product [Bursaphelenchus xylophilus]|uniref:(pine wood nematode) hypothetical protein n=1 Tax=Bursaphelenchus xylophilus TaxID=6326 RepID=A0A1I7RRI3_BURXY|nr:unnamed protein product [Bursaphelenchus xylophilus]CAG9131060.1 unnamed protein product [Bursaphelenchus xylophilus]
MGDPCYNENTFLCGYQRIRRYGSTWDLNSTSNNLRKPLNVVEHEVKPTDTLQNLQIKYNSNMFEIKRINKLWSNDALYARTHISVPIYDDSPLSTRSLSDSEKVARKVGSKPEIGQKEVEEEESVKDFFKRIDQNVRRTKKVVRKMNKTKTVE